MSIYLPQYDLLPGEFHIITKLAKVLIGVKESGLTRFAFNNAQTARLLGEGIEAVRGKAYLTNYRIMVRPYAYSRARGSRSLWLPSIIELPADPWNLQFGTQLHTVKFVIWHNKQFATEVERARQAATEATCAKICQGILRNPEAVGVALKRWMTTEALKKLRLKLLPVHEAINSLSRPDATSLLEIVELFRYMPEVPEDPATRSPQTTAGA